MVIHPRARAIYALITFCLGCMLGQPVFAEEAHLQDIVVTNSKTDLLVYFTVTDCFTPKMEEGVHNGIAATFTFYVNLYQIREAWPNRKIASHSFQHTLTYNNLREEYEIRFSETAGSSSVKELAEAKAAMSEIDGFRVAPLADLTPDVPYRLEVKAKLARKTLPFYVHHLVPFVSLWDFETDWYSIEFRY